MLSLSITFQRVWKCYCVLKMDKKGANIMTNDKKQQPRLSTEGYMKKGGVNPPPPTPKPQVTPPPQGVKKDK